MIIFYEIFFQWAAAVREHFEKEFSGLVKGAAQLETIATGNRWAEGPVWFGDLNCLLWSDIPNDRMLRYVPGVGTSEFRKPAGNTNGHTRDQYNPNTVTRFSACTCNQYQWYMAKYRSCGGH